MLVQLFMVQIGLDSKISDLGTGIPPPFFLVHLDRIPTHPGIMGND